MDALASAVSQGTLRVRPRAHALKVGLTFGVAQALVGNRAGRIADVLGRIVLSGIGLNTFIAHQFFGG